MIDLLERELKVNGIECLDRNNVVYHGTTMPMRKCCGLLLKSSRGNKKVILKLWEDLSRELDNKNTGSSCSMTSLLFIPAVKLLYKLSQKFDLLKSNGTVDSLKRAVDCDVLSYSGKVMSNVVEYRLAIEWVNHLIRKDLYSHALLKKYCELCSRSIVVARGVAGPWSRADLPMLERVFEWDDIAEEVAGREQDKRRQRRYRLGLEQYGDGDSSPNEGFYWREIRNEPYSFDSTEDSTYPHRDLLWI